MQELNGYEILTCLNESIKTVIYKGLRKQDQQPVIIKALKPEYSDLKDITKLKHEYEIHKELNLKGVVKPLDLEKYNGGLALILEDFNGESLQRILNNQKISLSQFLPIAISLAITLEEIHAHKIIHKDIKPSNIIINSDTGEVKITDFGISSLLSGETKTIKTPNLLTGTLAYMSPEQTGRMNRSLDYRTDFYSLGVTFYQMLTGVLPFTTNDPMELVHAHIAKIPILPHEHNSDIPVVISNIIMKLLSKNAEDRYQTALGLRLDLEVCLEQLNYTGIITYFAIGTQDISGRFQISEKLYGREAEVSTLMQVFERVSQGNTEMMLISGYSGIGKSSLVNEIHKPVVEKRGFFITGKFDQFQKNIPFSALIQAFQELIKQLLTEDSDKIEYWKQQLLDAFGYDGSLIIEVIPEVELIVGKQPDIPELGAAEIQQRFNLVFQKFLQVFSQPKHPLVIFLDDLQWADLASLKLLQSLITEADSQYLFLIGAYRDNEIDPSHPLTIMLKAISKEGAIINEITLNNLDIDDTINLISDSLHKDKESVKTLANLVFNKTLGNPFFINEFLKTLYQEKLLTFNFPQSSLTKNEHESGWQWHIAEIEKMDITDNVVELMINKLKKLPSTTQEILPLAACIGNSFDLHTLSIILQKSLEATFEAIIPVIESGLIIPTSELEILESTENSYPLLIANYKFLHDRVQQAAYSLINVSLQKPLHLQVGRLLLANTSPEEYSEKIFYLLRHLNLAEELIIESSEKIILAKLNLEAGKRAKESTAYASAVQYLRAGINCLTADIWKEEYKLAFDIHKELAESEYLNGNLEDSEKLIYLTLNQCKSALEKSDLYYLLIIVYTLKAKYLEAIQAGRRALEILEINLPENDLQTALNFELAEVKENLRGRKISSILEAAEVCIPEKRLAIKLLTTLGPTAYFVNQNLFPVIVAKSVNLSLKYGNSPESALGYCNYGVVLCSLILDYKLGYEFAFLGWELSRKYNNLSQKCIVAMILTTSINHWSKPIKLAAAINDEGYEAGLASGELQFLGYLLMNKVFSPLYQGENLEFILEDIANYLHFSDKTQNYVVKDSILACKIIILNLLGLTSDKLSFTHSDINELEYLEIAQSRKSFYALCHYQIYKAQIFYLYDSPKMALQCCLAASEMLNFIPGAFANAEYNFYMSLSWAAIYGEFSEEEQAEYWQKIVVNQTQMKIWADNCQENFQHKYLLVAAEMARLSKHTETAIDLYDLAIKSAIENGFIQDEALANELAAKFWLTKGKTNIAKLYMREAYYAYQRWGANFKIKDLEAKYPRLIPQKFQYTNINSQSTHHTNTTNSTTENHGEILDLTTVIKASQTLAGEIVLEQLLAKLMNIVMENAGAEKGFLILEKEGKWLIEATGVINQGEVTVLQSLPLESIDVLTQLPLLASAIVNYVIRTQKNLVLNDANREEKFKHDTYIIATQPKSILCMPLVYKGKLSSILYLENNLSSGAFTPDRLEILQVLSSQIAISIENAQLYTNLQRFNQNLEQLVNARTQELSQTLENLKATQSKLVESEKMAALGGLVAGVAHEINTPLGISVTAASLLAEKVTTFLETYNNGKMKRSDLDKFLDTAMQTSSMILANLNRAAELVQSFKLVAVDQSSELKRTFNVKSYLDEIFVSLRINLKNTKHHVEINCNENIVLTSYPGALSQIVTNLVMNSLLHAYNQNDAGKITINFQQYEHQFIFEYTDDGKGIPPENLSKIFTPFFTTKRGQGGSGLGLHIVYNLVTQKLNGSIECESQVGVKTKFIIKFSSDINN